MKPPRSIEEQLEDAWRALIDQPRLQRVFLTAEGRVRIGLGEGSEVGWFDARVSLRDFREAVLWEYEGLRRVYAG